MTSFPSCAIAPPFDRPMFRINFTFVVTQNKRTTAPFYLIQHCAAATGQYCKTSEHVASLFNEGSKKLCLAFLTTGKSILRPIFPASTHCRCMLPLTTDLPHFNGR
ncbi:hypothetical protein Tcan_16719 [Toxocara canis]|uniref:Uncharacterized protein n=1 Tax=Toxocara canis TaxID=6265 RepID=A0A0B2VAR1_TOXCA|nr:hypothetical protein Tcan_16719 [Toxocara canis]